MSTSNAPTHSLLGRALGDFVVTERLGSGGFGEVFLAEQPLLGRDAVVKISRSRFQGGDPGAVRFLREARLASRLDHPYAAHVYAFGVEPDGVLWIAMERVRGSPLDEVLRARGSLPVVKLVPFLERLCEVAHTAHEQGIVHRDLKPGNVMVLTRSGQMLPKLLDLGIAKSVEQDPPASTPPSRPDSHESLEQALERAESVELTQGAGVVGSPLYMAPEQWVRAGTVDRRADIYSLGILAFQCLTGRPPFEGKSVRAIARAHATSGLPERAEGMTAQLHSVLAKATAKSPDDRFGTALEFATAFRLAAGLSNDPPPLPVLESTLQDVFLTEAPQPIAEAVSQLEAAQSVRKAHLAISLVVHTVVRYLGAVAIAARAKAGPGAVPDAGSGLNKLRQSGLSDAEWVELARDCCHGFAQQPQLHPLPEMVAMLHPTDELSRAALEALVVLAADVAVPDLPDEAGRLSLVPRMAKLAAVLRALAFLTSYRCVVGRTEPEVWMGTRRLQRLTTQAPQPLEPGKPVLVDADGGVVVNLWPLVQMVAPLPEAAEEPFLLEGPGHHGARLVSWPIRYERHDPAPWEWLQAHGMATTEGCTADAERQASPYRGLSAFTERDTETFFGREREAQAFANRLRVQSLLAVVGPSGSGKSSFVQAGVLPLLPPDWISIVMRPGATPLETLRGKLPLAGNGKASDRGCVVLVVDQFEELVTLCLDPGERQAFAEALVRLAEDPAGAVRVVLTLRDDFLIRIQQFGPFRERLSTRLQLMGTPAPDDLLRILTEPARRFGYSFEDVSLSQSMVSAVADQPGALALLSFTAAKLWDFRDRQLKRMTRKAYDGIGGVGGALAHHAENLVASLSEVDRRLLRETFRALVTAEGTRAVVSRSELMQLLGGHALAEPLMERLIQARLLVSSETESGDDRIEVIHETLLSSWPRLVAWQREDAESARLRDQLRASARQWDASRRPAGGLWRGDLLAEYRLWRGRYKGTLTDLEAAFVGASQTEEARGRRIRRSVLLAIFAGLVAGLVAVGRANGQAHENLAVLHAQQGRSLALAGRPLQALVYLTHAFREGIQGDGMRYLISRSIRLAQARVATLDGHEASVTRIRFSPDETRLLTPSRDGTARLWNAKTGAPLKTLRAKGMISDAVFSGDGQSVATFGWDNRASIWDAQTGALRQSFDLPAMTASGAFSPDGNALVAVGFFGAKLWDVKSSQLLHEVGTFGSTGLSVARFSPDGKTVALAEGGMFAEPRAVARQVALWDVATGVVNCSLEGHLRGVTQVVFNPDGGRIASAGIDGTVRVWDVRTCRQLLLLQGHSKAVSDVVFSPDGQLLATSGDDRVVRVWDVETGTQRQALDKHEGPVRVVRFDAAGHRLATGAADGVVRTWGVESGQLEMVYVGHADTVNDVAFSRDGSWIVSASSDGSGAIWDGRARLVGTSVDTGSIDSASAKPNGEEVLTNDSTGGWFRVRDLASGLIKVEKQIDGARRLSTWMKDGVRVAKVVPLGQKKARVDVIDVGEEPATVRPMDVILNEPRVVQPSWDGRLLALSDMSATAILVDTETGKVRAVLPHEGVVRAAAFSLDGLRLVTGAVDGAARIWSTRDGSLLATLRGHKNTIFSVAFSDDGKLVATGGMDQAVRLWRDDGTPLHRLEGHRGSVSAVAFSHDGALLASVGGEATVGVWEVATGWNLDMTEAAKPVVSVSFLPRDRDLLVVTVGGYATWPIERRLLTTAQADAFMRCLAPFDLAGGQLVTARTDRSACPRLVDDQGSRILPTR